MFKQQNSKGLIFTVCIIHFLLGLDINIVSVSLSSISNHFNIPPNISTRIVWVYFLILTCVLLLYGKLGDIKGYKTLYLSGIFIFTLSSFLCSTATNFDILMIFRIFQALGAGFLFALTPAIITSFVDENIRGKIFGLNYAFTAIGGIIGRLLSGFLIDTFGWNSIFLINIPFGIVAVIWGFFNIPDLKISFKNIKFDWLGTLLLFTFLGLLLYFINTINEFHLYITQKIILLSLIFIFFIIFIFWEKHLLKIKTNSNGKNIIPIFNINNLKNYEITFPIISFALIYIITNGFIFLLPFFLQLIKNLDIKTIGVYMAVISLFQMLGGYISGNISDGKSFRLLSGVSLLINILSILLFYLLVDETSFVLLIIALIIYGVSVGAFIPMNTNRIMSNADKHERGSVSSLMTTTIRIGSALGVVIFSSILSLFITELNSTTNIQNEQIARGFHTAFLTGLTISILTLFVIIFIKDKRKNISNI